jgi:RNA polymerase sigma-70 factor (ECF subfamily)
MGARIIDVTAALRPALRAGTFAMASPLRGRPRASVPRVVKEGAPKASETASETAFGTAFEEVPALEPATDGRLATDAAAADVTSWLAAISGGADRAAFARLFRLYAPKVKGYLVARGAASTVADELTQEVMLTVWRKAAQFDARKGTPAAWLFTIARNRFLNHVRDTRYPQPELESALRAEGEGQSQSGARPDEELAHAQKSARLVRAVDALPPEQAAVLKSAYWSGQTLKEHADGQRLPLGTVKTRARLALARLRAILDAGDEP